MSTLRGRVAGSRAAFGTNVLCLLSLVDGSNFHSNTDKKDGMGGGDSLGPTWGPPIFKGAAQGGKEELGASGESYQRRGEGVCVGEECVGQSSSAPLTSREGQQALKHSLVSDMLFSICIP